MYPFGAIISLFNNHSLLLLFSLTQARVLVFHQLTTQLTEKKFPPVTNLVLIKNWTFLFYLNFQIEPRFYSRTFFQDNDVEESHIVFTYLFIALNVKFWVFLILLSLYSLLPVFVLARLTRIVPSLADMDDFPKTLKEFGYAFNERNTQIKG